jgi:DNA invertase Pin-like site-specific DNA recombinase
MATYGYARVSTTVQDLTVRLEALKAGGCDVIRAEKLSGTTTEGRAELATLLEFVRTGDVLMVTRIDRLARSIGDLQDIVRALRAKGASLRATEQPIDTSTAAGSVFWICSGCLRNSKRTCAESGNLRGLPRRRPKDATKAAGRASIRAQ